MKITLNWGWRIAIVYTFFAVSTVGFVAFAMSENVELVRKDYYEESLRYDASFASAQRGNAVGEQVTITPASDGVHVSLPASHASSDSATIQFYRAENSRLDRLYTITGGRITIPTSELAKGNYQAQLTWRFDGQWYAVSRQISVGS